MSKRFKKSEVVIKLKIIRRDGKVIFYYSYNRDLPPIIFVEMVYISTYRVHYIDENSVKLL